MILKGNRHHLNNDRINICAWGFFDGVYFKEWLKRKREIVARVKNN